MCDENCANYNPNQDYIKCQLSECQSQTEETNK